MDKYFIWIHYERLHNHNKAKHNKTVCIFLGIYCSLTCSMSSFKRHIHLHFMMTSPNGNIFRVTGPVRGEFFSQRPVTRGFDVFFLRLNKRLSEQSRRRWFDTSFRSWWHHCNTSPEANLKLKSREILFAPNIHFNCEIILEKNAKSTAVILSFSSQNSKNNLTATERWVMDERQFLRFEFKKRFWRTPCIAISPCTSLSLTLICSPANYDVIKWKHFPRYRPFVRGIFPSQMPLMWNLLFDRRMNIVWYL